MGASNSNEYIKKQKELSIITLNYSGILLSPFEFFSKDPNNPELNKIEQSLSTTFETLLKLEYPAFNPDKKKNEFKWDLGKIDQKMQKQRYTPIYHPDAGIKNHKFMKLEEFEEQWEEVFQKEVVKIKGLEYKPEQVQQAKRFDLMCYKTLLLSLYGDKLYNDGKPDFTYIYKLPIDIYTDFMKAMFKKSYLNEEKKIKKTFSALDREKIDITFVQEANEKLLEELEKRKNEYQVIKRQQIVDSIIVCRRATFKNFYKDSPLNYYPELKEKLFWNKDTTVAFVDNIILISGHLSSKSQKNGPQTFGMVESLKQLQALYPMCQIIVGCDGNSYLRTAFQAYVNSLKLEQIPESKFTAGIPKKWKIYPDDQKAFTTSKQRTYLQPQVKKANQRAQVSRDYLIFLRGEDLIIKNMKVCTISNKSTKQISCLPCEEHPYDHYVVKGEVSVNLLTDIFDNQSS